MKNNVMWALVFATGILVLLTGAYLLLGESANTRGLAQEANRAAADLFANKFVEVPLVTDSERHETNPGSRYAFSVHFPTVAIVSHQDLAKETNAVIVTFVEDIISNFKKNISIELGKDTLGNLSSDLSVGYTVELISPTIMSVRFDTSEYYAGAAHPNSKVMILNYDIEKHHILQVADLFASSTEALPFLSDFSRDALKQAPNTSFDKDGLDLLILGTEPTAENFANVTITKAGLTVIFNPYQIAPYARGSQQVHIPLSKLEHLLVERVIEAIYLGNTNIRDAMPEELKVP